MSNDLDDFEFDDFDIPDFDTDGMEGPKDDRNPVSRVAGGFVEGLGSATKDRNLQRRVIDGALPKGYGKAFDELDSTINFGKDIYDTVKDEILPAKRSVKKLGRFASSKLKGILPDSITSKLDELSKDNEDSLENIDPVATEINTTLTEIFGAQQEEESKNRFLNDVKENAQFKTEMDVLNSIRSGVNKQVAYQDKVLAQVQRKSLEIQFKQYFTAKSQFELLEAFVKESKISNDLIVKNTALPDFVKMRTNETAKEMMRQRLVGKALGSVGEFTKGFMPKLKENILAKVKGIAGGVKSGLEASSDSMDMMEGVPTDSLNMGGNLAAGVAAGPMAEQFGKFLKGIIGDNPKVKTLGSRLEYAIDNKDTLIYDAIKGGASKMQSNNVYIKGEDEAIINFSELKSGRFIDVNTGKSVRSINDITGPVTDADGNLIITQEDFEHGLQDDDSRSGKLKGGFNKLKRGLGGTLSESIPDFNSSFVVSKDAIELAEESVPYSALTDKTITEIIPGLLTDILHEQEMSRRDLPPSDVERRLFNFDTNRLETESSVRSTIKDKILPKELKDDIQTELKDLMKTLDPDDLLAPTARNAFLKQLLKDASEGTKGFSIERFLSDSGLSTVDDPEIKTEIRDFLIDSFLDDSGKFNTQSVRATKLRTDASRGFNKVKDTLPDYQTQVKRMSNLYGNDQISKSGFTDSKGNGDISSILSEMYGSDFDFVDKNGVPFLDPLTDDDYIDTGPPISAGGLFALLSGAKPASTEPEPEIPYENDMFDDVLVEDENGNVVRRGSLNYNNEAPQNKEFSLDEVLARQDESNTWLNKIHNLMTGFLGGNEGSGGKPNIPPTPKPNKTRRGKKKAVTLDSALDPDLKAPSFDGGGVIPDGEREGGIDGKGGFWAILHPGETVHDPEDPDGHKNPLKNAINGMKIRSQKLQTENMDEITNDSTLTDGSGKIISKLEELRQDVVSAIKASGTSRSSSFSDMDLEETLSNAKGKASGMKEGFMSRLNIFKKSVKKDVTIWKDIYVNGNSVPSLESSKLKMGFYIDQVSGKVIESYDDIKGPVVDKYGQVVISLQDLYDGLEDEHGKPADFISNIQKKTGSFFKYLKASGMATFNTAKAGTGLTGKLLGGASQLVGIAKKTGTDIYKKGFTMPVITLKDLELGRYRDKVTGKVIQTFEDIKGEIVDENGNIIISLDDIKNGTLLDTSGNKLKINWSGIRGFIGGSINKGLGGVSNLKDMILNPTKAITGLLSEKYNQTLDVYVEGDSQPRLRAVIMKNGGYLSKSTGNPILSIDDINGEVIDLEGNVLINSDDLRKDIYTSRGKKLKGLTSFIGNQLNTAKDLVSNTAKAGINAIKNVGNLLKGKGIRSKTSLTDGDSSGNLQVEYLDMIYDLLNKRLPDNSKVNGDTDGDGFIEGSWQDKKDKLSKGSGSLDSEEESSNSKGTKGRGLLSRLKGMVRGGKDKDKSPKTSAPGKSGMFGKLLGGAGSLLAAGGSMLGSLGSVAASVGSGIAAVASGAATLISAPVLLGVAAVAAIGIGGYLAYKHLYKSPNGPLHRIRLAQYGVDPDNKDQLGQVTALEAKLWEQVQFREGKAELGKGIKDSELYEFFGVNPENTNHVERFNAWFVGRFKPVFLIHANSVNRLAPGSSVMDADDNVDKELRAQYINSIKFPYTGDTPYQVMTSPFEDELPLVGNGKIQEEINIAIKEVTGGKGNASVSKEDRKVTESVDKLNISKTTPKVDVVTKVSKSNNFLAGKNTLDAVKGGTTFKAAALVEVPKPYGGKINALLAVKLKSYGLTTMSPDKVATLMTLERGVILDIVTSNGVANFKANVEPFFNKYAPLFGLNVNSEEDKSNWMVWFTNRFLPVLLSYCNAALRVKKDIALSSIDTTLKAANALTVARATYQTLNSSGVTIWNVTSSPWKGYTLNNNVESVFSNLSAFKTGKEQSLGEERSNESPESIKTSKTSTNLESDINKEVEKSIDTESHNKTMENASVSAQQLGQKRQQRNQMNSIENILNSSHSVQVEIRDLVKQVLNQSSGNKEPKSNDAYSKAAEETKAIFEESRKNKALNVEEPVTIVPNMNMSR